jgi:hypothetical protein
MLQPERCPSLNPVLDDTSGPEAGSVRAFDWQGDLPSFHSTADSSLIDPKEISEFVAIEQLGQIEVGVGSAVIARHGTIKRTQRPNGSVTDPLELVFEPVATIGA